MKRIFQAKAINPMLGKEIPFPTYSTDGAAGLDVRACIDESVTIEPGCQKLIGTGLAVNIADTSVCIVGMSRSGLSLKSFVRVAQGTALIDSDYGKEIGIILQNYGQEPFVVSKGDRIAQLVFMPVIQAELTFVSEFSDAVIGHDVRGGYGSTGVA